MLYTLFNVIYVLVAVAMIAFILLQQGSGSAAGSGFGAGASATVFGARGSANFLSKSTAILATIFMVMSLGMAMYLHKSSGSGAQGEDLGIMGSVTPATTVPAAPTAIPQQIEAPAAIPAPAAETPPAEEAPAEAPVPASE
ncbi:MAG TPA: preprotein translocase subunit SecG [Chiayiivirga sp.]|jgi:preprotein translocase subunit SecG|uniref:Protein-export membrane protein SecG n=1 Tax=Denitratimonas tolerans TaxID=1338420 RepID=A0AAW9R6K0_9GAMM|nr:preprotein translocase subunit SecG [Xanthomonadaceae bacterium]MDX9763484.1 preprotein translocase subunit SecG [Chiayiivirga sp.]MEB2316156.1 preprotein translocase subunit SecG [Xanthomonadaceae bacterium]HMN34493.1 preprotein translocase subunit SecG [Chiayiivirga sp.]HRN59189.1 preprotein translocase subunit SecG [Chiayiivirga sp.]